MMFIETQFPIDIAYGSQGGPQYSTRIVTSVSGYEDRNANWEASRHSYDAASGVKTYEQLEDLLAFFHVVQGSTHGFRWPDDMDNRSCARNTDPAYDDQILGGADGVIDEFQLIKTYTFGASTRVRTITKPLAGFTPLVGVLGSARLTTDVTYPWSWDSTTGVITFTGTLPPSGNVTAGYKFDVPCRLRTDSLSVAIEHYHLGTASVPVVEIRV